MRILDVSPRGARPQAQGSVVRSNNLLRHLSERHEVRQFAQTRWRGLWRRRWVEEIRFSNNYRSYQYVNPASAAIGEVAEQCWVRAPVLSGKALSLCRPKLLRRLLNWADVVLVEFPWQFDYCLRLKSNCRFVLASHNVEAQKFRSYAEIAGVSTADNRWLRFIDRIERKAAERADLILAVSEPDRRHFISRYRVPPDRVVEVPNGADTKKYFPVDTQTRDETKRLLGLPQKTTILFVGGAHPPNHVGLRWARRMAKLAPQFTFLVVGPICPEPFVEGNMIATGRVEDYSTHQQASDIAICPIQHGGGTKIKLLESLAAGLPTVAFAPSIEGTRLRANEHLLVAEENEKELLDALCCLSHDLALAGRLSVAGRNYIVENHDWEKIARKLESTLLRFVGDPKPAAREF